MWMGLTHNFFPWFLYSFSNSQEEINVWLSHRNVTHQVFVQLLKKSSYPHGEQSSSTDKGIPHRLWNLKGHVVVELVQALATNCKVVGSSPDEVNFFSFNLPNPSSRTMALR
jgi:hypothetical protein